MINGKQKKKKKIQRPWCRSPWCMFSQLSGDIQSSSTGFELQSRFGDTPPGLKIVCPRNGTAARKRVEVKGGASKQIVELPTTIAVAPLPTLYHASALSVHRYSILTAAVHRSAFSTLPTVGETKRLGTLSRRTGVWYLGVSIKVHPFHNAPG